MVVSSLTSGLIRPAFRIDRHQIDVRLGIECAAAIALPLIVGLAAGQPVTAAWGAIGAFLANFSVYQPGYRVRVRIVVVASVVIAAATFLGAVTGIDNQAVFPLIAVWSFLAGLLVALGPSAAMIGVVSSVGLAVATALNATPTVALEDAAAALAGGLGAAVLAFAFHRRGQRAEAAALGAAYRVLAGYAHGIGRGGSALPEGTAFDAVGATLARPGPHRTRSLATRDRALAARAERLRTVLAALAVTRDRLAGHGEDEPAHRAVAAIDELADAIGTLLDELADCCATDRAPSNAGPADERLRAARRSLAGAGDDRTVPLAELVAEADELVGSVRRLLADETADDGAERPADWTRHPARLRALAHRPDTFDEVRLALRANLTLRSTACRHALRLAVTVTVATVLYRVIDTHDGYWIVVAVLFIMKPDFGSTVGRGILRAVGTLAGVTLTTLLLASLRPGPVVLAVIAVAAAVFAYALFNANYGAFTVFLTCLTVALAAMIGLPAMTAVANRAVDNLIASGLAIMAVVVWPTWVATEVPRLVAACLRAEHRFGDTVLAAFVRPPGRPATEPVRQCDRRRSRPGGPTGPLERRGRGPAYGGRDPRRRQGDAAARRRRGDPRRDAPLRPGRPLPPRPRRPPRRDRAAGPRPRPPGPDRGLRRARRGRRGRRPGADDPTGPPAVRHHPADAARPAGRRRDRRHGHRDRLGRHRLRPARPPDLT